LKGHSKVPWVMRLPGGLREQPAWIFIGTLCALAGLSYLVGLAESSTITQVLDPLWVRVWGGYLCLSGLLVVGATWMRNSPLERMALRFLSLGFLVYMGWLLAVLPPSRAALTVTMCLALCVLAEIRIAVLTMAMWPLPPMPAKGEDQ
jgi:hypothetical protein